MIEMRICKLDPQTGAVLASRRPRFAPIQQLVEIGTVVAVCEDFREFPAGESNVYAINDSLHICWEAEEYKSSDKCTGFWGLKRRADFLQNLHPKAVAIDVSDGYPPDYVYLVCASWGCTTSLLDPANGKVVVSVMTK